MLECRFPKDDSDNNGRASPNTLQQKTLNHSASFLPRLLLQMAGFISRELQHLDSRELSVLSVKRHADHHAQGHDPKITLSRDKSFISPDLLRSAPLLSPSPLLDS